MLIEIYITLTLITFILLILSFLPIGENRRERREDEAGVSETETQMYIPWFAWITMGLLFMLSITSMDIEIVTCGTVTESINSSVTNLDTITSAWTCNTTQYISIPLAYLFGGLGLLMLIYAILTTFTFLAEGLAKAIGGLK